LLSMSSEDIADVGGLYDGLFLGCFELLVEVGMALCGPYLRLQGWSMVSSGCLYTAQLCSRGVGGIVCTALLQLGGSLGGSWCQHYMEMSVIKFPSVQDVCPYDLLKFRHHLSSIHCQPMSWIHALGIVDPNLALFAGGLGTGVDAGLLVIGCHVVLLLNPAIEM